MSKVYKVIMTLEVDVHDCKDEDEAIREAKQIIGFNPYDNVPMSVEVEEWEE